VESSNGRLTAVSTRNGRGFEIKPPKEEVGVYIEEGKTIAHSDSVPN